MQIQGKLIYYYRTQSDFSWQEYHRRDQIQKLSIHTRHAHTHTHTHTDAHKSLHPLTRSLK